MMNNNESLEKISKTLMLQEPFYGLFLIMLNKQWRSDISTAGVSKNGINYQLAINSDFWNGLSEDHKIGLLKHELMHLTFHHITMRDSYANHKLFNIAADITINQHIDNRYLPQGAVLPDSFPEIQLNYWEGTDYYYNMLETAQQNGSSPSLDNLLSQMGEGNMHMDHSTWDEFDQLDEATKKLLEKQADYLIKEVAEQVKKNKGNIPGEVKHILDRIYAVEEPKFDWRGYLRRFAGGSVKVYTKKLRRKFNKRYEDSPGLKIKPKKHILVAIDTSGSVNNNELKEFMNEIHHIHKTGSDVTIVQCDVAIKSIEKFNPKSDIAIHGRGGTEFDPVIDYYNANKRMYTSLIYFTDGECSTSSVPIGKCLWVLSSVSNENNNLPGQVIKLN
jgi:predicted metal-dependent peptidase